MNRLALGAQATPSELAGIRGDRWNLGAALQRRQGRWWKSAPCPSITKVGDIGPCSFISTRMASRPASPPQERLINWGYAVCDAAMRRRVEPGTTARPAFPYPNRGV
jgi:hypothetical protein